MSVLGELAAGLFGLLVSTIGIDQQTGVARFAFDRVWLLDGGGFIVLTVALFGVGEVLTSAGMTMMRTIVKVGGVMPTRAEWRQSRMPILRGSLIGFLLGALIMFGIRTGPELFDKNAQLVWTVIASMYIGNLILLVMNLPLAGLFAQLLRVPYSWLYPPILALCVAGVYSQANSIEDVWTLVGFGALGWAMLRYDWPAAPMILGLVLGMIFENSLRQSMALSHGSLGIFFTRPISAALLAAIAVALLSPLALRLRRLRRGLRKAA